MERDYIMKVVCESTLAPEAKIKKAVFECLVSILSSYYEKIAPYKQNIFNITVKVVKEDEESVALQAIEFWSSICDEEIDILEEYGVARTIGDDIVPLVMPFIEKNIRKPDWRQKERDIVPLVMPLIVTACKVAGISTVRACLAKLVTTCKVAGISTVRACLAKLMCWAYAFVI
nr:importin subunit beta-1 [Tanacetum cinerariifolium]